MSEIILRQFSMFDCIGGEVTVDRLVECFYARMDALSEAQTIRAMHARDLGRTKDILKWYLAEWLGGPKRHSAERGHPRLRGRHIEFKIGEAELRFASRSSAHSNIWRTGCGTIPAIRTIVSDATRDVRAHCPASNNKRNRTLF
jgi:hypothetical protein